MEQFNKTVCDHLARGFAAGPTAVEIAASTFAAFALFFCLQFS